MCDLGGMEERDDQRGNNTQAFLGSIWTGVYTRGSSLQHEMVHKLKTTPKGRRARKSQRSVARIRAYMSRWPWLEAQQWIFELESSEEQSVQFSSVAQSCPTVCDPMNCSTPGLPVHHQLLEFTQTHQVSDAIQPSHPLSSPSPPAPNPSQHKSFFQWVNSSHVMAKILEFQLQHQSFQWILRTDLL